VLSSVDPMLVHSVAEIHFTWIDGPIVIQRGGSNQLKHRPSVGISTCAVFVTAIESYLGLYNDEAVEPRAERRPLRLPGAQVSSTTLLTAYKYPLPQLYYKERL
jgi:hypothetical protein